MAGGHLPAFGVLAEELSGAEATRRVFLTAGGLLLLGLALLIATVWWWRATRPEHPVLAPLEVMGERRWSKSGGDERRRLIEESRTLAKAARDATATSTAPPASAVAVPPASAAAVAARAGDPFVAPLQTGTAMGAAPVASAQRAEPEPEPVDLSVLVGSGPLVPDDLAEMDLLLGLVPAPGATAGADLSRVGSRSDEDGPSGGTSDGADIPAEPVVGIIDPTDLGEARTVAAGLTGVADQQRDATAVAENVGQDGDGAADADPDRLTNDPLLQRTSLKD